MQSEWTGLVGKERYPIERTLGSVDELSKVSRVDLEFRSEFCILRSVFLSGSKIYAENDFKITNLKFTQNFCWMDKEKRAV